VLLRQGEKAATPDVGYRSNPLVASVNLEPNSNSPYQHKSNISYLANPSKRAKGEREERNGSSTKQTRQGKTRSREQEQSEQQHRERKQDKSLSLKES
jgi:hypothetical protein